jgi:hypothetical protein
MKPFEPRSSIPALICALALLLGGCTGDNPKGEAVNDQFAELLKRPDIDQVEAEYQGMLTAIRDKLVREVGVASWVPDNEGLSGSACGFDFPDVGADGKVRRYSSGVSPGNITDEKWPAAVATVVGIAAQHGFGAPDVVVDRPGDHEVSLKNPSNAQLLFGTAANTTLSVSTGCHLTAEAHQRGTPTPKEPLY